jgi:hypothetical protein
MNETTEYPKSQVTAHFHSVQQNIEFVSLEQDNKRITLTPDDCLSIMMKVLDQKRTVTPEPPKVNMKELF